MASNGLVDTVSGGVGCLIVLTSDSLTIFTGGVVDMNCGAGTTRKSPLIGNFRRHGALKFGSDLHVFSGSISKISIFKCTTNVSIGIVLFGSIPAKLNVSFLKTAERALP